MKLSNSEILSAQSQIPKWEYDSYTNVLKRIFLFNDFKEAIQFVNKVADTAEVFQHHPNILIEYNKVTLNLSTHNEGGITDKDISLAENIDKIV